MASEKKIDELSKMICKRLKGDGLSIEEAQPYYIGIMNLLDELDDSVVDKYLKDIAECPKAKHDVLLEIAVYYHKGLF